MLFANPASRNGVDIVTEPFHTIPAGLDENGNLAIMGNRVIHKPRINTCRVPMTKCKNNVSLVTCFGIDWV